MKLVNQLARLPEISQTMQQMSMEMTKVFHFCQIV
jgi:charged multivesicular body protein 3